MQVSTATIGALIFTPMGDLIKTIKLQGVIFTMATIDKINKDIAAAKAKIAELQKKIRTLEAQKIEEENLQIVKLVKTVNLDQKTLTVFFYFLFPYTIHCLQCIFIYLCLLCNGC